MKFFTSKNPSLNESRQPKITPKAISFVLLMVLVVTFGLPQPVCTAQKVKTKAVKLKADEDVKVLFQKEWREGIVVATKGKKTLVEFDQDGNFRRLAFTRPNIRLLCEVDAMDYCRKWRTASGKTTVEAALKKLEGENVVLIRRSLKEITVPVAKLSKPDISYVKRMKKWYDKAVDSGKVAIKFPPMPPLEDFGDGGGDSEAFFGTQSFGTFGNSSDTADSHQFHEFGLEKEYYKTFRQGGVGFKMGRFFEKLKTIIPVGGPEQLVLASTHTNLNSENLPNQLYWISLNKRKVVGKTAVPAEYIALDYNPELKKLLTFKEGRSRSLTEVVVWDLSPKQKIPVPTIRFGAKVDTFFDHYFGKIIDENIVLIKNDRGKYTGYNLKEKEIAYKIHPDSFFSASPVLSPDKKHFVCPEDGSISVFDTTTGKTTAIVNTKGKRISGVAVHKDGKKLAAITRSDILVWDLSNRKAKAKIYPAPLIGSPFGCRISWIGDNHILGEGTSDRILYNLDLKLPVWTYKMSGLGYSRNPALTMVRNDLIFYVADIFGTNNSIGVGAVSLPGPKVKEVTKKYLDRDLMLVKKGTKVKIDTSEITTGEGKILQWIQEKAEANQWVIDENAQVVIKASMGVGKSQTVDYIVNSSGNSRGRRVTVTFEPHWAKLQLIRKGTIIWHSATATGAPNRIRGRNVEARVKQYQTPRVSFFQNAKMPAEMINPKYSRGFGVSSLGVRGIQIESLEPPGRANDPFKAQRDADQRLRDKMEGNNNNNNQNGGQQGGGQNQGRGAGGSLLPLGAGGGGEPPRATGQGNGGRGNGGRGSGGRGFPPGGFRGGGGVNRGGRGS